MASDIQKYFIVSGTVTLISVQIRKKWSIAVRLVKTIPVKSRIFILSWRNSFAVTPSTFINDLNSNFNPNSSAKSKYGDFSVVGFGCETSIFFIFNFFCFKITLTSLTYPNSLYKTRIGNISSPQRYKIIYKIETLYPYNILINLINLKTRIMIPIPEMTYNNIFNAEVCT